VVYRTHTKAKKGKEPPRKAEDSNGKGAANSAVRSMLGFFFRVCATGITGFIAAATSAAGSGFFGPKKPAAREKNHRREYTHSDNQFLPG
jgi:hypothetical protein